MENIEHFSFEYSLSKDDYLNLCLFELSKNKKFMKKRFRNKVIIFILLLFIPIILSIIYDFQWLFLVLWIIITPLITFIFFYGSDNKYKQILEKNIDDKYLSIYNNIYYLEFFETYIFLKANNSESKISNKDLNEFVETKDYFFVQLASKNYINLKKENLDFEKVKSNLIAISKNYNIPYKEELNWKFK